MFYYSSRSRKINHYIVKDQGSARVPRVGKHAVNICRFPPVARCLRFPYAASPRVQTRPEAGKLVTVTFGEPAAGGKRTVEERIEPGGKRIWTYQRSFL